MCNVHVCLLMFAQHLILLCLPAYCFLIATYCVSLLEALTVGVSRDICGWVKCCWYCITTPEVCFVFHRSMKNVGKFSRMPASFGYARLKPWINVLSELFLWLFANQWWSFLTVHFAYSWLDNWGTVASLYYLFLRIAWRIALLLEIQKRSSWCVELKKNSHHICSIVVPWICQNCCYMLFVHASSLIVLTAINANWFMHLSFNPVLSAWTELFQTMISHWYIDTSILGNI